MKEVYKGIVWPRGTVDTPAGPAHRYVVIGMLVTSEPIPEFDGKNEIVLSGNSGCLAIELANVPVSKTSSGEAKFGDANDVLLGLGRIK